MSDPISRKALIAEYDRVHVGPPGGARKLMEDAPEVKLGVVAEIKIDNDALQGMVDEVVEQIKAELFGNSEQLDTISIQAAIEARRYTFGNDEFNLEAAHHDCKLVFDGITDDDSFQEADTGLILYYANEIIYALQKALEGNGARGKWIKPTGMMPPEHAGHYECSNCGFWAMRDWLRLRVVLTNFCPNCGADMREEME